MPPRPTKDRTVLGGWTQLAFAGDLEPGVHAVDVGGRALVAVVDDESVRVVDGRCPHRGAHLGHGGRADGTVLVCPFHGHRIHLGDHDDDRFCVREHPALRAAGGVFALLGDGPGGDSDLDTGMADHLRGLDGSHHVVPGFELEIAVPPRFVIENVFDADHFASVHAVSRRPRLEIDHTDAGALVVDGRLPTDRPNVWQEGSGSEPGPTGVMDTRFRAHVYGPHVVVTELGETADGYVIITAATPTPDGCHVRVTAAFPRSGTDPGPTVRRIGSIMNGSRTAFQQDTVIWEHLDPDATPNWTHGDELVRAYHDFCAGFALDGVAGP